MKHILLFLVSIICINITFAQNNSDNIHNRFLKRNQFSKGIPHPKMYDYDMKFIALDIEADTESNAISGQVNYKAKVTASTLDQFVVEATPVMEIAAVNINGISCEVEREGVFVIANIANPIGQDEVFDVNIVYSVPKTQDTGLGKGVMCKKYGSTNIPITYSSSEPFWARNWMPTKQFLTDKFDSCYVYITCPKSTKAVSQGLLKKVVELKKGKHQFQWESKYPIDYYLISFTVADYIEYRNYAKPTAMNGDSILVQHFIINDENHFNSVKPVLDQTPKLIETFSDVYGLYPFYEEKYGHAEGCMSGAMENQTISTMGYIEFGIVAHELSHQWYGDYLTCGTWNDLWVNEGFASYSEYIAMEHLRGEHDLEEWKAQALFYALRDESTPIYIPDELVHNEDYYGMFNYGVIYRKGAYVLHMLRNEINDDEVFFNIMKSFIQRYKNSTATGDDFFNLVNETTLKDYNWFKDQWYYGSGYPKYDITWRQEGNKLHMQSNQSTASESITFFRATNTFKIVYTDGTFEYVRLEQTDNIQDYTLNAEKTVAEVLMNEQKENVCEVLDIAVNTNDIPAKEQFTVFPVPAKEYCQVKMMQQVQDATINIYDNTGKCIFSDHFNGTQYRITTSEYKMGIYLICIETPEFVAKSKVIMGL